MGPVTAFAQAGVLQAETIETEADLLAPDIVGRPTEIYALDFGFDRERSQADGQVRGLNVNSQAAKAGLREGEQLRGWSMFDNVDRQSEIVVERDGEMHTIRFYPRGATRSVLQFTPKN